MDRHPPKHSKTDAKFGIIRKMEESFLRPSNVRRAPDTVITWALVGLGGAIPFALATLGYFGLQFGIMTSCTNEYACTETLCAPCVPTFTWLTVGAGLQVLLIIALLVGAVRYWRRRGLVAAVVAGVILASVGTVVGTTWAADRAYCRPGDPGALTDFNYCGT